MHDSLEPLGPRAPSELVKAAIPVPVVAEGEIG